MADWCVFSLHILGVTLNLRAALLCVSKKLEVHVNIINWNFFSNSTNNVLVLVNPKNAQQDLWKDFNFKSNKTLCVDISTCLAVKLAFQNYLPCLKIQTGHNLLILLFFHNLPLPFTIILAIVYVWPISHTFNLMYFSDWDALFYEKLADPGGRGNSGAGGSSLHFAVGVRLLERALSHHHPQWLPGTDSRWK